MCCVAPHQQLETVLLWHFEIGQIFRLESQWEQQAEKPLYHHNGRPEHAGRPQRIPSLWGSALPWSNQNIRSQFCH